MPEVEELFDPYAVEETPDTGLTALAENFVSTPFIKPDNSAKVDGASAVEKIIQHPTEPVMVISLPQNASSIDALKAKTKEAGLGKYTTQKNAEPITLKVLQGMSPEQQEALRTIIAESNEQFVIRIPVAVEDKPFPIVYQQEDKPKTETFVVDLVIDAMEKQNPIRLAAGFPHEVDEKHTYFPLRWKQFYLASTALDRNNINASIRDQISMLVTNIDPNFKIKDKDIDAAVQIATILSPQPEKNILDQYKAITFMPNQEEFDLAKALEVVKENSQGGTYPLAEPIAEIMKKVVYCKDTTDPYAELTPVEWSILASLNLFDPKKILARRSKSKSS